MIFQPKQEFEYMVEKIIRDSSLRGFQTFLKQLTPNEVTLALVVFEIVAYQKGYDEGYNEGFEDARYEDN